MLAGVYRPDARSILASPRSSQLQRAIPWAGSGGKVDKEKLKGELRRDEGLRLEAYRCTQGHRTIGYGHLIDGLKIEHCSIEQAEEWLDRDVKSATLIADSFLWPERLEKLDEVRQRVVVNMAFNLGFRLLQFKKFYAALRAKDWALASREMKDSLWARQVKGRADRLVKMMETGSDEGV